MEIYVVQPGDTLEKISRVKQVPEEAVIYVNQIQNPDQLVVGQALLLAKEEPSRKRTMIANGFAYPFIKPGTLIQTLPYLTDLSVFSYGFTLEGNLVPPEIDPDWMIEQATEYHTRPVLTLTPFGPDGKFNNYLIHNMVMNESIKWKLIENILKEMEQKGYLGIDVDFEYILKEDKDSFTEFVGDLAQECHSLQYQVSVDLAPKTSREQKGLLYEGKDYVGLGRVADLVMLMTYEWGYTYGPPMAVAPIHMVKQVVDYAVTAIPPEKINLGIPNYGYDWPLPFVQGETKATTIGNIQAVQIAWDNQAEIIFDQQSQAPFFQYEKEGIIHEVWFEDVRSMEAKFKLKEEYGLHGVGYWQIMRLFLANWWLMNR